MRKSKWFALMYVVALVGVAGCSSDDDDPLVPDIPDLGNAAAAQIALNGAMTDVVDPLFLVVELIENALAVPAPASRGELICPDVSGVCNSGTLTCSSGLDGLTFTATNCTADVDGDTVTMDGSLTVLPGLGTLLMTFNGLSVNGSTAITGTVLITESSSSVAIDIGASDGTMLDGVIIDVDDNDPDDDSTFVITVTVQGVGVFVISFDFDNTSIASTLVTLDGSPVATCSVDLDLLDADCVEI